MAKDGTRHARLRGRGASLRGRDCRFSVRSGRFDLLCRRTHATRATGGRTHGARCRACGGRGSGVAPGVAWEAAGGRWA